MAVSHCVLVMRKLRQMPFPARQVRLEPRFAGKAGQDSGRASPSVLTVAGGRSKTLRSRSSLDVHERVTMARPSREACYTLALAPASGCRTHRLTQKFRPTSASLRLHARARVRIVCSCNVSLTVRHTTRAHSHTHTHTHTHARTRARHPLPPDYWL
jgi:hypothetical protein